MSKPVRPFHVSAVTGSVSTTTATLATAKPKPLTLHSSSPYLRPHHHPTSLSAGNDNTSVPADSDFYFWPNFFDEAECKILLEMALWKLDRVDSSIKRRRNRQIAKRSSGLSSSGAGECEEKEGGTGGRMEGLQGLFNKDYGFEEGHYDSVIHKYRETLLSSLPSLSSSSTAEPNLSATLSRLYSLLLNREQHGSDSDNGISSLSPDSIPASSSSPQLDTIPPPGTITHLLHLSPEGEILPHVDNLQASGSVICGVSLGAERTLRLRQKGDGTADETGGDEGVLGWGWDVRLPSGSVYMQK
ncbi:hypothetical protein I316_04979 [Kwoniella heveanensis BCC8398]|uniref:Alpha-ketoglutarate-dependent dioxygenase AlkB-like domain-containing protein n=1 Tax=Kwoniella heveanensis BCC8398 TaxID=1296120 RepID=A0A1B9GQH2_9TREE|nr:hypothetical protein I316_04979 [Kwoniella heveanensis BCC8398]